MTLSFLEALLRNWENLRNTLNHLQCILYKLDLKKMILQLYTFGFISKPCFPKSFLDLIFA